MHINKINSESDTISRNVNAFKSLKTSRKMRIVKNAFQMHKDSFRLDNNTHKDFNIFQKIFKPKTLSYFREFQRTQPFLPITKFPPASIIKNSIKINPDGTTDIKGVYVDSDGLVILDFNNVKDWEKIGFPKCSKSKGIFVKDKRLFTDNAGEFINVGNIRFFAHALYPDKKNIEGFETCTQKGTDAMLSFSYGGRSDLIGFFFQQGIIAYLEPRNIVGGQNNWDKHSLKDGFKKTLNKYFQDCWIENSDGFSHRETIAGLTKSSIGMNDSEYIKFLQKYKDEPLQNIQPPKWQNKIIEAFANFYAYIGGYVYDEIYGIEPVPMGVFVDKKPYNTKFNNILDFVDEALSKLPIWNEYAGCSMPKNGNVLKEYALKKDIPLIVFNW